MGGGGSMGGAIGGTTSPGLFGTAKPPAAGMTGGFGGATSTGFGMSSVNANSGAGSLFSPSASAPVASGSAGLNSIQAVQQRVQAIYAQRQGAAAGGKSREEVQYRPLYYYR